MSAPTHIGRYRLVRRLDSGGMGEVHLAEVTGPGGFVREVALKLIRSDLVADPKLVELFLREARAAAAIGHRNVVQVHELGVHEGRPYLVMERLKGIDLRQWRASGRGPMPWRAVAFIGAELARALGAVHATTTPDSPRGLVHGDLSPSNVLVCFDGAVKVLDFGLARAPGTEHSESVLRGKLGYLPPEALAGVPLDARADVYALGVVIHELLTGRPLFKAANDAATMQRVLHGKVPAPRAPGLPRAFGALLAKAIARDRGARTTTMAELERDLEALQPAFGPGELAALLAQDTKGTASTPRDLEPTSQLPGVARGRSFALGAALTAAVVGAAIGLWPQKSATPPSPPAPAVEATPVPALEPGPASAPAVEAEPVVATTPPPAAKAKPKPKPANGTLPPGFLANPFHEAPKK